MFPYLTYLATKNHTFDTSKSIDQLQERTKDIVGMIVAPLTALMVVIAMAGSGYSALPIGVVAVVTFVLAYIGNTELGFYATKRGFDAARRSNNTRLGI